MVEFSATAWIALGLIAGIGILAMLNSAATVIRNQTYVHNTRVKVNVLRREYLERIQSTPEPEQLDHPDFEILPNDSGGPPGQAEVQGQPPPTQMKQAA